MTKIMLVEDDKSLREIYGVRLLAEGYDIVSAGDGEEALAMAIKERPTLIISDVMMPKISGFDMLDILRSTTETREIKVIMMTALSSEDQRDRGQQLGADRYLVKSQVGIEDVVRTVHEVLGDAQTTASAPQQPQTAPADTAPASQPQSAPAAPATNRAAVPAAPARPTSPAPAAPAPQQPPLPPVQQQMPTTSTAPKPPSSRNKVIQPLADSGTSQVNINELLDKELAKEAGLDMNKRPEVATADQEKAAINDQLNQFQPPTTPTEGVNIAADGTFKNQPGQSDTPPLAPPKL